MPESTQDVDGLPNSWAHHPHTDVILPLEIS